jgi:hypothetical protein
MLGAYCNSRSGRRGGREPQYIDSEPGSLAGIHGSETILNVADEKHETQLGRPVEYRSAQEGLPIMLVQIEQLRVVGNILRTPRHGVEVALIRIEAGR